MAVCKGSRTSRRPHPPPPQMAVAAVAVLVVLALCSSAEAAVLVKSNATSNGSCLECRIAEDLELEMLLVHDLYYATAHIDRMLADPECKPNTPQTSNPTSTPCRDKPGQQNNCNPCKDPKNNKDCPDPFNRNCKK